MKLQLFIILIVICSFSGWTQKTSSDRPGKVEIGQRIPNVSIPRILNYKTSSESFSNLKGKFVILDFWGVNCSSCITGFSRLQNLRDKFGERLQVFLVTREKEANVKKLFSELKILKDINLPIVADDSLLSRFFPYRTVPTQVWIDAEGVAKYKTSGKSATDSNVARFLAGEELVMDQKDEKLDFDATAPLWLEGNGRQVKHLVYYSYITKRITDLNQSYSAIDIDSATKRLVKVQAFNSTVLNLYQLAFSAQDSTKTFVYAKNRIIFAGDRSLELKEPDKRYCYELMVDPKQSSKVQLIIQQDLERFFSIKGEIKKTKILCNVITFPGDRRRLPKNIYNGPQTMYSPRQVDSTFINNVSVNTFLKWLASAATAGAPIIDETNIKANIGFAFPRTDLNSEAGWKSFVNFLSKYGFKIKKKVRRIDMLIIKDVE